ncbi:hypothetical protein [Nannocystis pusilla]|uniref:hypothetical protein n=1 Tax=Nannocystis pusilla TaxID=889268 RepID=UPI003B77109E
MGSLHAPHPAGSVVAVGSPEVGAVVLEVEAAALSDSPSLVLVVGVVLAVVDGPSLVAPVGAVVVPALSVADPESARPSSPQPITPTQHTNPPRAHRCIVRRSRRARYHVAAGDGARRRTLRPRTARAPERSAIRALSVG